MVEDTDRTENNVVSEVLRRQVWLGRFTALQEYGREQAEAREIGPEDSEDLVDELRSR
ncbi:MAG TPA: hypothetical protein VLC07_04155 [Solirubrobacterales bacterium]|nr:hypothetical protein [Solirubrobacterales bacterium]